MIDITKILDYPAGLVHFNKGDIITKCGENSDALYLIVKGTADVYMNYGEVGEVKVAALVPGAYFGEFSLFLGRKCTETIVAAEDVLALAIDHSNALEFFQNQAVATFSLIQSLCTKIINTNATMAEHSANYENAVSSVTIEKEKYKIDANIDPLTGVYNRRYFLKAVKEILGNATDKEKESYIVMIDFDFFKMINDTYGHQVGDRVIEGIAAVVTRTVRVDDLFARYGGEEFILFLNAIEEALVRRLVERIRSSIEQEVIEINDAKISITASFGISSIKPGEDLDAVIEEADKALYKAKESGRNQCIFYDK